MSNDDANIKRDRKAYNVSSKDPNKYEEDYDPKRDNRKYTIYRNDIKYRSRNDIDMGRAIFDSEDVRDDFLNGATDTLDYRIKDCEREKYQVLDLAHMTQDVFDQLYRHEKFESIVSRIEILTANDCGINDLPDLTVFTNLICLNIGDNNVSTLPRLPSSLEELIIDNNQVESIPYMSNLKRLRARNNRLRRIHYSDSMESLNLSKNRDLIELAPLSQLYHLEVGETGVTEIPLCPNLKYLDLYKTRVETLPDLPKLHILTCIKSKLSDISNLTNLYSLVSTGSMIRRVHYMDTLQKFSFDSADQKEIRLSRRYKAHRIFKNKNDVIDMMFKLNPVPVNVMTNL